MSGKNRRSVEFYKTEKLKDTLRSVDRLSKLEDRFAREELVSTTLRRNIILIADIAKHYLNGLIPCTNEERAKLKVYEKELQALASTTRFTHGCRREKEIILGNGGNLLGLLIPPVMRAVDPFLKQDLTKPTKVFMTLELILRRLCKNAALKKQYPYKRGLCNATINCMFIKELQ